MSILVCDHCGGYFELGHEASNCCESCGHAIEHDPLPPVVGLDDSELAALRAEVASLRKENERLKKIERQRWENVNKTFGANYSTEKLNTPARFNPSFGGEQRPRGP